MIQELLGGAGLTVEERKIPINGSILEGTPTTVSPSPSPSSSSTSATANSTALSNSENQNLRCPRCDSSNTKFCYYNNYNLTQPRHFCKTCRRYWTKGGALRNVPIGGGCRKTKNTGVPIGKSTAANKMKTVASEIGLRSGFGNGMEHEPLLWPSAQNSHILALLRATTQNPNPNPVKEEVGLMASHGMTNSLPCVLNARTLGSDPLNQLPSMGLCSPLWKNNQPNGIILGEVQNTGIQELYQRLKSSSTNYYSDTPAVILPSNVASYSSSASSSSILESAPVSAGSELGYWNPVFSSWSDLPTTNGAYP